MQGLLLPGRSPMAVTGGRRCAGDGGLRAASQHAMPLWFLDKNCIKRCTRDRRRRGRPREDARRLHRAGTNGDRRQFLQMPARNSCSLAQKIEGERMGKQRGDVGEMRGRRGNR
jgi:hypothetical protein